MHFVKIHPYFEAVKEEQYKLKTMIADKSYKNNPFEDNEVYLYNMIKNSNFDLSRIGIQKNAVNTLNFKNPSRADFRPHHGLHLGIFRTDKMVIECNATLQSDVYLYYVNIFKDFFNDKLFCDLIKLGSEDLKSILKRLTEYYRIDNFCRDLD
ncbi:unnamed protein product [marine sediment metagenome]|uniref:Uncharacterized protein n=1 Tax=marine sediment metagenome TaxID=412755 RepID=X1DH51_9ZZZZ